MAIQQKLHTKLVQKLILTPSLQQAIKLLPMSTLELVDLLNQEMVENPMLEEVPTEELQPVEADAGAAADKPEEEQPAREKTDTCDDSDYEYFFGDYLDDGYRPRHAAEVKELPRSRTRSRRPPRWRPPDVELSLQTDDNLVREIGAAVIETWTTTATWLPRSRRCGDGLLERGDVAALRVAQGLDPIGVAARTSRSACGAGCGSSAWKGLRRRR